MNHDNTRDTMNWKPMALFAALSLFGIISAISLGDTAPVRFGIAIGIALTAGLTAGTLAFLHGVKNYRQAKAAA